MILKKVLLWLMHATVIVLVSHVGHALIVANLRKMMLKECMHYLL